jgi:hypothetical protein
MDSILPNNSDAAKALESEKTEKVVNRPVVQGKVKHRTTMGKLLRQTFIPEDVSDAKDYILTDLVMPAIKNGIFDTILNIIDYWRGGAGTYRRPSNVSAPRPRIGQSYDYNRSSRLTGPRVSTAPVEPVPAGRYSYDDIVIEDYPPEMGGSPKARADAEGVLVCMQNTIDRYSVVRISDLYDFVGLTGVPNDYNYGWTNISSASVRRVSGGWLLVLPKAMPIDTI